MTRPVADLATRLVERYGLAEARVRVGLALGAVRRQVVTRANKERLVFRWLRLYYVSRSLNRMPDNG